MAGRSANVHYSPSYANTPHQFDISPCDKSILRCLPYCCLSWKQRVGEKIRIMLSIKSLASLDRDHILIKVR